MREPRPRSDRTDGPVPRERGGPRALAGLFGLMLASVGVVALAGPISARMGALQLAWGVGSAAWLAACLEWGGRLRGIRLPAVVVGALMLRALAWAGDPGLSDDAYRYVWEGGLVAEGASPYAHPPDSEVWAAQRAAWPAIYRGINHKDVSAAYPPLTQCAHAAVVSLVGGPEDAGRAMFALRAFHGLCDLLCLIPLVALLRSRGRPDGAAIVWAWCPLVALEFAGSAHFDSLGILLLLSGLAACDRGLRSGGWRVVGVLGLTAGALVKLLPALALPFALRGARASVAIRCAALAGAVFVLAWLPFATNGGALLAGLSEYGLRWEAASLVFRWLEAPFAAVLERDGTWSDPRRVARVIAALLWLAVAACAWFRVEDPVRATGVAIGAFLVLSPTLHPWYLAWIVPFVAVTGSAAWLLLVALAPLLYWPLAGWHASGVWVEPGWLWPAVALPFFGSRLAGLVGGRKATPS